VVLKLNCQNRVTFGSAYESKRCLRISEREIRARERDFSLELLSLERREQIVGFYMDPVYTPGHLSGTAPNDGQT
jgi:hypothetical protein